MLSDELAWGFRQLFIAMRDNKKAIAHLLAPWPAANPTARRWLHGFVRRPLDDADPEDLWVLYALSRVLETILLSYQPGSDRPHLPLSVFVDFVHQLGATTTSPARFHPFDHEIVRVEPGETGQIEIIAQRWPTVTLGPLLLQRGGVDLRAGPDRMHAQTAEGSKLFWTWQRQHRPVEDLSHGWGHNSQWRTAFRRDYRIGDTLHFNVDGKLDLGLDRPPVHPQHRETVNDEGLSRRQRVELLVNRSFVLRPPHTQDLWPYEDTLVVQDVDPLALGRTWPAGRW